MPKLKRKTFYQKCGKRLFDFTIGWLVLISFSPLFLIIALLILFDSGWPIIFVQKRVGKNGKIFTMFKFRTMVRNAEKLKKGIFTLIRLIVRFLKSAMIPNLLALVKNLLISSLDELPQLINVLLGQMSLVGPRPLPVDEEKKLKKI